MAKNKKAKPSLTNQLLEISRKQTQKVEKLTAKRIEAERKHNEALLGIDLETVTAIFDIIRPLVKDR